MQILNPLSFLGNIRKNVSLHVLKENCLKAFALPIISRFFFLFLKGHWQFTAWKGNTDFIF